MEGTVHLQYRNTALTQKNSHTKVETPRYWEDAWYHEGVDSLTVFASIKAPEYTGHKIDHLWDETFGQGNILQWKRKTHHVSSVPMNFDY